MKTIQNAATETVWAIKAKNTRNNIDYDSTMWQTAVNVPVEVEACREMHRNPFTVYTKEQLMSMTYTEINQVEN